jgi:uncharacterized protein
MSDSPAISKPITQRRIMPLISAALEDTRVVLINGPRQAGKTTIARQFANSARPYVTLDDNATLRAAREDPSGFIRGLNRAVIDEIQRAPELMLAIKESVDEDQEPGRFLLTGSANLTLLPAVGDSLAGRIEVLTLLPFAQAELRGAPGRFLDQAFSGELPSLSGEPVTGDDLVKLVLLGGYPEIQRRASADRRQTWMEDYISLILDRDVRDIASVDQLDRLPRLVNVLAEHAGQLVNQASFGASLNLSRVTAQKYVAILERLFLIRTLSPWSSNRLSRLIKTPKLHFLDSGLLAALRGDTFGQISADRSRFGPLLETFVVSEIAKLATWSGLKIFQSHYRTKDQDEVDLVLEDRRGRIVGIEVKASATVRSHDFRGLRQLEAAAGDKFMHGFLLHDHDRMTPISEKIHAMPVSTLWNA